MFVGVVDPVSPSMGGAFVGLRWGIFLVRCQKQFSAFLDTQLRDHHSGGYFSPPFFIPPTVLLFLAIDVVRWSKKGKGSNGHFTSNTRTNFASPEFSMIFQERAHQED